MTSREKSEHFIEIICLLFSIIFCFFWKSWETSFNWIEIVKLIWTIQCFVYNEIYEKKLMKILNAVSKLLLAISINMCISIHCAGFTFFFLNDFFIIFFFQLLVIKLHLNLVNSRIRGYAWYHFIWFNGIWQLDRNDNSILSKDTHIADFIFFILKCVMCCWVCESVFVMCI